MILNAAHLYMSSKFPIPHFTSPLYLHTMSSTAALIAAKRRSIIRKFKEANAFDERTAIDASEHNIRRSFIFKRLLSEGIILPVAKNVYYLDVIREKQVTKNRRKKLLLIFAILAAAGLLYWFIATQVRL